MNLIEAKNVSLTYPKAEAPALFNIHFQLKEGRITQFLGKSGSGKTTLLKCMANLVPHFTGELTYRGRPISHMAPQERACHIGFVSQSFDLFPHMTVLENCMHPQMQVLLRKPEQAKKNAESWLEHLGVSSLGNRWPRELSGGQKQRVAIARALSMDSELLLLDEPTSALDPESSMTLVSILRKLQSDQVTLVISTHDMSFSLALLDEVFFMKQGQITEHVDIHQNSLAETQDLKQFFSSLSRQAPLFKDKQ